MNPSELSYPVIMDGSAATASGSFPASQMNNGSMANQADESQNYQSIYPPSLQSVVGMNFQPTGHASFNQGYQVQSNIQSFNHTSQPQSKETYQTWSLNHQSDLHSQPCQSIVAGQCLTDLLTFREHTQPTSQPQLNETRQNQTLIHHSNSQHTGQFQSNVAGQSQTDLTNSVPSDSLVHPQPTSQPQLNETRQYQTLIHHSNSQHTGQFQSSVPGQNQTDLTNSVQSNSLVHPQPTSQPQLNHGYSSQGSQQKRTRRPRAANEAERRERRKESDQKYKKKMKQQKIETNAEIENLKRKNVILVAQKQSLSDIIIQMQPNAQIPAHMRSSLDCGQQPNEQIPAQMGQLYNQQIHYPSFSAPVAGFPRSHHGEDSEEFDQDPEVSALRMQRDSLVQLLQGSTSCQESNEQTPSTFQQPLHSDCSAQQQLNGSQFSNDVQDPPWTYSNSHGGGIASSSNPTEKQDNSRALMARILKRIGEKRKSTVTYSDFPGLGIDERVAVGKYSFPKSLKSTVENITHMHGDVSENSTMPQCVDETIYILFCATIKEMDDLQLPEVTENCIIKWSDTIKAALGIKFDVGFAMDHLKDKIIPAFVGQIHCQRVDEMEEKISNLEASLNALKQDHAKECEQSKVYKDAMDKFNGKSVSSGLFM
ncbi:hypothetical protein ERO13_D01G043900v2 [Gossypium hirsutum]|uniref:Uncharacterized protein LOC107917743 n=3 Tax=Gossypium TaxID=3633 RepID=A0A1U8KIZ6_GOSHI|nr:uncharacterized protein LOC107917743 [Gossypium hirsutum]XP_040942827.1 uncharacterized protein LOC107917743 [Gossypium hirsutum]KAG4161257.1 hypothetical protein ERO13_D01G043900v2 [Gossypium hirsutum]